MKTELTIDGAMKEKWQYTRVGCLQYRAAVGQKSEELWKYLKGTI